MESSAFSCEFCPAKFSRKRDKIRHVMASHQKQKDLTCNVCHKNFSYKSRMLQHAKIHSGLTNVFNCATCGKSFSRKLNLAFHQSTHKKALQPIAQRAMVPTSSVPSVPETAIPMVTAATSSTLVKSSAVPIASSFLPVASTSAAGSLWFIPVQLIQSQGHFLKSQMKLHEKRSAVKPLVPLNSAAAEPVATKAVMKESAMDSRLPKKEVLKDLNEFIHSKETDIMPLRSN